MILLDPDLAPDPSPRAPSAKRKDLQPARAESTDVHIPSVPMLARFLSRAQAAAGVRDQVTVLLTTDSTMRRLNRRFRGKNKATDVLSFPADRSAPGAKKIAGDLAIGVPMARRQAAEHGHSLAVEIKVLILHGLLHLAGYDHETDSGRMGRREQVLRDRLGLPLGLIERAGNFAGSNRKAEFRADGSFGFVPSQVRRKNMNAPNLRHPASRGNRQVEDGRS